MANERLHGIGPVTTWEEFKQRVRQGDDTGAMLAQVVAAVELGGYDKLTSLMTAALALSAQLNNATQREVDLLMRRPAAPILLCPDCPQKDAVRKAVKW